jgi:predicted HTH transcriptional regulator
MNKQEITALQNIIMGRSYDSAIIDKAIEVADIVDVKVCLRALKGGLSTFQSRMLLQDFVCRLQS